MCFIINFGGEREKKESIVSCSEIKAIINTNHEIGTSTMNDVLCFPSLIPFAYVLFLFGFIKIVSKFYNNTLRCFGLNIYNQENVEIK